MHLYNSWLPPPVAAQTALETQAFSETVRRLQQDWQPQLPSSALATFKWISVVNNFIKAKSELAIPDVEQLVKILLDLFMNCEDNCYVQARWGSVFSRVLQKYAKKIDLSLDWRPFYELLLRINFKRQHTFEGVALKQFQVSTLSKIICKCRRFFPRGSAAEIWAEFRPMLENLSHNSSLEAAGFISLFLPTNPQEDSDFFTSEWLATCLHLWNEVPNCPYWDLQWASLVGRCIKKKASMPKLDMEQFVPLLFSHYLSSFEVPVGKASASYPYQRQVTREVMLAFSSEWSHSLPKEVAKSIVFLLKPSGSAQRHLERMVNLLEQYYHPSNGGLWTSSLERFLRNLVIFFLKRLAKEQRERAMHQEGPEVIHFLSSEEREAFVRVVMRLIERGQFSKNASLARTAAMASSGLAYVEPLLVLPLSISRFQTALDTITATHQLEAALKTIALSARALLLASLKESSPVYYNHANTECAISDFSSDFLTSCRDVLNFAMFHTLLGLDANDPPKSLATLQLFCSIFSSLGKLGSENDATGLVLSIDWSEWLDDFLSRLFTLLLHIEPSSQSVEAVENDRVHLSSNSFLVQGGSFYPSMLELLFARLTKPLFEQALKKVVKFLHNHTLPGVVAEMGLLCSAIVYASPQDAMVQLVGPIIGSVLSSLEDCPPTGFSGSSSENVVYNAKLMYSPALETSIVYQLKILSLGLLYAGESILQYRDLLKKVIAASFDAPSSKVNDAGGLVLSSVLRSIILFYPLDQYKLHRNYPGLDGIEDWISTKGDWTLDKEGGPTWHSPNANEVAFANELLDLHLKAALAELRSICQLESPKASAQEKEHLRVILLRIDMSLCGVRSCLPDFGDSKTRSPDGDLHVQPSFIAGAAGVSVGCVELREDAANTLHMACEYLLKKRSDDSVLLSLLTHSLAVVGNSGSAEFSEWSNAKDSCNAESKVLVEPASNYITDHHVMGQRRPKWMIIQLSLLHNTWRASQSRYNWYRAQAEGSLVPYHIMVVTKDLIKLALHNYDAVREMAGTALKKIFKRFPLSLNDSVPILLDSLQDPTAPEHAALGACGVLTSRPALRHLTQDFGALSSFLSAILNSAHHESVKAQNAINTLFILFNVRFGGLPLGYNVDSGETENFKSYADLITKIQSFCASTENIHWRYNLMAQGMLVLLTATRSKAFSDKPDEISSLKSNIAGHYLSNLKSELPPLRPLSVIALLLLLHGSPHKLKQDTANGKQRITQDDIHYFEASLASVLREEDFGTVVLHNLSLDHHYADGQNRSMQGSAGRTIIQNASNGNLTTWMPVCSHDWPRTRTWDSTMKGDAFTAKFAKLFKSLVQECGSVALAAFRHTLEVAGSALEERGKQCAVSEVIAGFLQSDVECVLKAWEEWLQPLFKKLILQSTVESTPDWAACIRFAVTGKGRTGKRSPLTRPLILKCLAEPVPPSTSSSVLVKHFTFLCAALTELSPMGELGDEITFQKCVLKESLSYLRNPAPQVRELVGTIICIVGANLQLSSLYTEKLGIANVRQEQLSEEIVSWKSLIVSEAHSATIKCQNGKMQESRHLIVVKEAGKETGKSEEVQDAVKLMETVVYFIITAVKSGHLTTLMDVIVELLQPVLCLQETSHKDLSSLAKVALHLLKLQVFPEAQLPRATASLLSASKDKNWHTRVASLSFLQSFTYRHTFLLPMDSLVSIWDQVKILLVDDKMEVREIASVTLAGMMKGSENELAKVFREHQLEVAITLLNSAKSRRRGKATLDSTLSPLAVHGIVLGLSACVLSVPYDMPRWLPKAITTLAQFAQEPAPIRETVRKTVAEFRRTHADTWAVQKSIFTEEELEILMDTSSSASYFA